MVFGPLVKGEQVGVAKDEHGCNAAAGYTWSEVQAKCIRLFEDGIQFQSVQDTASALAAYVVFSADSLKAEVLFRIRKIIRYWTEGNCRPEVMPGIRKMTIRIT